MVLILEDGSGVASANSYIDAAFVTTYLTDRNRLTENTWSTGSPAALASFCIQGTDYVETRFRTVFRGLKQYSDLRTARAVLTLAAVPLNTETVIVGSVTYTFGTAVGGVNSVLIGASASASIDNLVGAIQANADQAGVEHGTGTVANPDASALAFYDDTMVVLADVVGTPGNTVATTTTVTGATWSFVALTGGSDVKRPQPLSFPRRGLLDLDNLIVIGVPYNLKAASAEYAVRAKAAALAPDPVRDDLGGVITRLAEGVGPLRTDTSYLPGTVGSGVLTAYPAADRLLRDYTRATGVLIRG